MFCYHPEPAEGKGTEYLPLLEGGRGDSQRDAGLNFAPDLARSSPYQGEDTGGVMIFSGKTFKGSAEESVRSISMDQRPLKQYGL